MRHNLKHTRANKNKVAKFIVGKLKYLQIILSELLNIQSSRLYVVIPAILPLVDTIVTHVSEKTASSMCNKLYLLHLGLLPLRDKL